MARHNHSPLDFRSVAVGAALATVILTIVQRRRDRQIVSTVTPAAAAFECTHPDSTLMWGEGLTEIHPKCRRVPDEAYGAFVRLMVIVCTDVILRRKSDGKVLLVQRAAEPLKGYWFWPGGRIYKGETFFAAAKRKIQEEVGLSSAVPTKCLGIYNTSFPTSAWDSGAGPETGPKGTQTVNAVVLLEYDDTRTDAEGSTLQLDKSSEACRWISANAASAEAEGLDEYVYENLKRLADYDAGR